MHSDSDPHEQSCDVAVIGGGIAGLVAARDLVAAGLSVLLFECATTLGGRIRQVELAGLPVELGAEAFATRGGAVEALAHELGLETAIVRPEQTPAWVITPERAYPLPAAGALGIPAKLFSARHTIGLRSAMWAATEPLRPRSKHAVDASIAEVAHARLGTRITAELIAPVVSGVYSAAPENLRFASQRELAEAYERSGSLVKAAREIRRSNRAAGGAVASFEGGLSRLVTALVTELHECGAAVHTGSRVHTLEPEQTASGSAETTGWRVRAENSSCRARAVVLAVPSHEARRLTGTHSGGLRAGTPGAPVVSTVVSAVEATAVESTAVEATAVETVALVVDAPALGTHTNQPPPRGTGALIAPDHPRITAKALTHATAKWGWLRDAAPAGRHVLRLSYGSRNTPPATAELSDAAAAALALRDASNALGVPLDHSRLVAHARGRWCIPTQAEPQGLIPGLYFTSEAYVGTGLASVVPHARRVAREAAREIARSPALAPPG